MSIKTQLRPLIERENKICELAKEQLIGKCRLFEDKYKLSSDDFYKRFQDGKMGDEQDFFEWKALIEGIQEWQKTKAGLKELTE